MNGEITDGLGETNIGGQRSDDFGWLKPLELDKALLEPQSSTSTFTITIPVYKKEVLAVLIKNPKDGSVFYTCLLYTSPSPRDRQRSRMPSSA